MVAAIRVATTQRLDTGCVCGGAIQQDRRCRCLARSPDEWRWVSRSDRTSVRSDRSTHPADTDHRKAVRRSPPGPEHALVAARHGCDAAIDELLHALTLVGLGRVEIALGIGGDAVHAVELPGLASAVAE